MLLAMSFSMDIITELLSLVCEIVDLKYVLLNFSFEKLPSPEATVAGIVE